MYIPVQTSFTFYPIEHCVRNSVRIHVDGDEVVAQGDCTVGEEHII